jgi:hypothetical protein
MSSMIESWNNRMAQAYTDGLRQGEADALRGENWEDEIAPSYQFEGCFRQGYHHGQNKIKRSQS